MLDILEGVKNKVLSEIGLGDLDVEILAAKRLQICNKCSLISNSKIVCDKTKSEMVKISSSEYKIVNGCGCILSLKVRSNSKCPLNKWN